MTTSPCGL